MASRSKRRAFGNGVPGAPVQRDEEEEEDEVEEEEDDDDDSDEDEEEDDEAIGQVRSTWPPGAGCRVGRYVPCPCGVSGRLPRPSSVLEPLQLLHAAAPRGSPHRASAACLECRASLGSQKPALLALAAVTH